MYQRNCRYARDIVATARAIKLQVTAALDTDDLLRAALVQGVSALDHFVHEEVRVRMLEIEAGARPRAQAYGRFRISLDAVQAALLQPGTGWLDSEIRDQHGFLSFQQPDKIADAFRLVSDVPLWPAVASGIGLDVSTAKRQLKLIVDRRNRIAHEADTDPTPPRSRYPIDETLVLDSLRFLDDLVDAIYTSV